MKTATNLLSSAFQKRQHLRRFLRQWGAAWIACLLIGGFGSANQWRIVHRESHGISEAEARHQQVQQEMRRGDAMQSRMKTLEAERDGYQSIANTSVPLTLLGLLTQSAKSANGALRLNTINVRESTVPSQKNSPAIHRMMIDIEGTAKSDQAVGRFVRSLHQSGAFEAVELKSSRGTNTAETTGRQFRLQCVFPVPKSQAAIATHQPENA